ncbi:MAG: helix-turn-helix transcriptional regulator [Pirellulaceae bacterium]
MNFETMSDSAISQELGARLRRFRLNRNFSQVQLATRAGIGRRTLQKVEDGEGATLATLVAILRGLGLLSQLDNFLRRPPPSPVQMARMQGRQRQRASGTRRRKKKVSDDWSWGD